MNKSEFLDILRQAMDGEVDPATSEQNVKYYDEYISSKLNNSESAIEHELGDPRLIAKSIIEAERAAKQKMKYTSGQSQSDAYRDYEDNDKNGQFNRQKNRGGSIFSTNIKWYHKALFMVILVLFLFILLIIGRFILKILFVFATPIILILLLYMLFRRR